MVIEEICHIYFLSLLGSGSGYFHPHLISFHKCFYLLRSESSEAETRDSRRAAQGFVQHMCVGFEAIGEGPDPARSSEQSQGGLAS